MVLGRMDDIVITGGHKVDLADVEQSVQRWAADHGAHGAVLGIPDRCGAPRSLPSRIRRARSPTSRPPVRESLPAYAVPRELIYLDQLPWLASGKPDRVAIRSMIMNVRAERQASRVTRRDGSSTDADAVAGRRPAAYAAGCLLSGDRGNGPGRLRAGRLVGRGRPGARGQPGASGRRQLRQ